MASSKKVPNGPPPGEWKNKASEPNVKTRVLYPEALHNEGIAKGTWTRRLNSIVPYGHPAQLPLLDEKDYIPAGFFDAAAKESLIPYLAMGFVPQATSGEGGLCAIRALTASLRAVRNLVEDIPNVSMDGRTFVGLEHLSEEDVFEIWSGMEYRKAVFEKLGTMGSIGMDGVWDCMLMSEHPDVLRTFKEQAQDYLHVSFLSREALQLLLQVINKRLGTFYDLGYIIAGDVAREEKTIVVRLKEDRGLSEDEGRIVLDMPQYKHREFQADELAFSKAKQSGLKGRAASPWMPIGKPLKKVNKNGVTVHTKTYQRWTFSPSSVGIAAQDNRNHPVVFICHDGQDHWESFTPARDVCGRSRPRPVTDTDGYGFTEEIRARVHKGLYIVMEDCRNKDGLIIALRGMFVYDLGECDEEGVIQVRLAATSDSGFGTDARIDLPLSRLQRIQSNDFPIPVVPGLPDQGVAAGYRLVDEPSEQELVASRAHAAAAAGAGVMPRMRRYKGVALGSEDDGYLTVAAKELVRQADPQQVSPSGDIWCLNQDEVFGWAESKDLGMIVKNPWGIRHATPVHEEVSENWPIDTPAQIAVLNAACAERFINIKKMHNETKREAIVAYHNETNSDAVPFFRLRGSEILPGKLAKGDIVRAQEVVGSRLFRCLTLRGVPLVAPSTCLAKVHHSWGLRVPIHRYIPDWMLDTRVTKKEILLSRRLSPGVDPERIPTEVFRTNGNTRQKTALARVTKTAKAGAKIPKPLLSTRKFVPQQETAMPDVRLGYGRPSRNCLVDDGVVATTDEPRANDKLTSSRCGGHLSHYDSLDLWLLEDDPAFFASLAVALGKRFPDQDSSDTKLGVPRVQRAIRLRRIFCEKVPQAFLRGKTTSDWSGDWRAQVRVLESMGHAAIQERRISEAQFCLTSVETSIRFDMAWRAFATFEWRQLPARDQAVFWMSELKGERNQDPAKNTDILSLVRALGNESRPSLLEGDIEETDQEGSPNSIHIAKSKRKRNGSSSRRKLKKMTFALMNQVLTRYSC